MASDMVVGANPSVADPWTITEEEFPVDATLSDKIFFLLRYAVLAPSGHNTQPWLFAIEGETIELYADRTRALPVLDPFDRELTISCGAALLNLRLALRHFGFQDTVEVFPSVDNPDLLARIAVGFGRERTGEDDALFASIPQRHTNRQRFDSRTVTSTLVALLTEEAGKEGVWLRVLDEPRVRRAVVDLVEGGEVILWEDKRFRRELAAWVHPNRKRHHDGIPGYAQGLGDLTSLLEPFVVRSIDMGHREAKHDWDLMARAPILAVLETDEDNPADWLATGQAMERVLLRAQVDGVSASFLNQPIEVPELRSELTTIMGGSGYPQLILRMGYGPAVRPTPRRPVDEALFFPE